MSLMDYYPGSRSVIYDAYGRPVPRRSRLGPGEVAIPGNKPVATPYDPSPVEYASVIRNPNQRPPQQPDSTADPNSSTEPGADAMSATPAGMLSGQYPSTWLTAAATDTPTDTGETPRGWGKTVSLEGGLGPGRVKPAPDSGAAESAPGARGEARRGTGPRIPYGTDDEPKKLSFGDIFNRIGDMINSRSGTLMALGAGMAGAPSLGTGIGRGLQMALPAMQQDIAQGKQNQTAMALVRRGLSPDLAQAAVNSPDILKQLLPGLLGTKAYQHVTITDAMGNQHIVAFDPATGKIVSPGGADAGSATPNLENIITATKEHMTTGKISGDLSEDERAVVSAARAYMEGGVMPTGNPRQKTIASKAKEIAQRVALELGEPHLADDALYPQRRTKMNDLAKTSNSSAGGIITNGRSAFDHLGLVSDAMVRQGQLGSEEGLLGSVPAAVSQGINWTGNVLGTPATKGKMTSVTDTLDKYGPEATKFYSGAGGGVEERTRARKEVGGRGTTAAEQAAFLESERDLMLERLHEQEQGIRETLGENYLRRKPVLTPELEANINKITANIKKLRGGVVALAEERKPTVAKAPPPGWKPSPGAVIRLDKDGNLLK